jgi:cobalamin biosynthesis protein CbiG
MGGTNAQATSTPERHRIRDGAPSVRHASHAIVALGHVAIRVAKVLVEDIDVPVDSRDVVTATVLVNGKHCESDMTRPPMVNARKYSDSELSQSDFKPISLVGVERVRAPSTL